MANPSTSFFGQTGDAIVDAATRGYFWSLTFDRTIDWCIADGFNGEFWTNPASVVEHVGAALDSISSFTNVRFQYVGYWATPTDAWVSGSEVTVTIGQIGFPFANSGTWGRAYFPSAVDSVSPYFGAAGDVYLNMDSAANNLPSYEPGSSGWFLLIHELGHALGRKHPHDDGGTGRPTLSDIGLGSLDFDWFTIMSYADTYDFNLFAYDPATPMAMDVLALQYLYGKNYVDQRG